MLKKCLIEVGHQVWVLMFCLDSSISHLVEKLNLKAGHFFPIRMTSLSTSQNRDHICWSPLLVLNYVKLFIHDINDVWFEILFYFIFLHVSLMLASWMVSRVSWFLTESHLNDKNENVVRVTLAYSDTFLLSRECHCKRGRLYPDLLKHKFTQVHGYEYGGGRRDLLYDAVRGAGKKLWNSEYGEGTSCLSVC